MKFLSFVVANQTSYGYLADDGIVDLGRRLAGRADDLRTLLAQPDPVALALEVGGAADHRLQDVTLLPVIPNPEQIFCVGLNYADHVAETNRQSTEQPMIFLRVPASQVGHGQPLLRPRESERFDYEGEIAVIIGKPGRRISEADSWDHIAGYACYNDGSVRDWQLHTAQWGPGKNFYRTGGFGPWMVTADEIGPDEEMTLVTRVNGVELQRASTRQLIHSIPKLIAYLSTITPLAPGDVIVTGTPGGIGLKRTPPLFLKPGDTVEIDVDRIGTLVNGVADD
ncbi:5-carboxymethyl-2-hydroxymuconate isomerase [Pseudomonas alkylphenolica]|uniref:5-carboxymethyl-2-hydroxymuconate isomerase n=1 Tax=Pseudomonas alkylphenolica TaxID=237609 RepID=A0A443ZHK3_9PSED|nr:fumarylacetoacetate hydrolase family protein [Pseudomonas alkylphenolica]RWU18215.1 5-carboxymethyl-2-hydroxymuconate isomerase [Pseudomonas alkylphenolica]